jgi:hypothetical protein
MEEAWTLDMVCKELTPTTGGPLERRSSRPCDPLVEATDLSYSLERFRAR